MDHKSSNIKQVARCTMQEDEEQVDDGSLALIETARKHQEHGDSIALNDTKDPIKCKPFLDSLILALVKRESALGRYTFDTAQTYASIGNIYHHMRHPRAVAMFRASYRIKCFLYGKCSGQIAGDFKGLLADRGLSDNDTEEIRKDILNSARHEVQGDILRRTGDRRAAAMEYQKAVRIEEVSFGKDNPDLAYLWRKMACLALIKKSNMHILHFDDYDRLGTQWVNDAKEHISISVCHGIKKGDKYYQSLLYGKAIKEYAKTTLGDGPIPIPKPPRRNRRSSTAAVSIEQELRTLIGSTDSSLQSRRPSTSQSRHTGSNAGSSGHLPGSRSEKTTIKVSTEPMSIASNFGAVSQDSSRQSASVNFSQRSSDGSASILPRSKRSSSSKNFGEIEEEELASKDEAEDKDSAKKSERFENIAVASSVATSDDGSLISQPSGPEDNGDQSSLGGDSGQFLATSLNQMASKTSSRSIERDTETKKPKSESTLRQMAIKPASRFTSRAMKSLRRKTRRTKPKLDTNAEGQSRYEPLHSQGFTAFAPDEEARDYTESLRDNKYVDPEPTLNSSAPLVPVIKELSSPVGDHVHVLSAGVQDEDISGGYNCAHSRRILPEQNVREISAQSITENETIEKSKSRRPPALERAKAASLEYGPQQRQYRQRVFKEVIPINNHKRDSDMLVNVGSVDSNRFLVFEDPANSSSSPSPTRSSEQRR